MRRGHRSDMAGTKSVCPNRRHSTKNVGLTNVYDVREPRPAMQRRKSTEAVKVSEAGVENSKASAIPAPPRMEPVARPDRQPSEPAPTESDAKTQSSAPSPERHISRRPERTVETSAIQRARPPRPPAPVGEPAPVVIRSPSPGLVANPRPTVVGLVGPVAVAVRSPAFRLVRHPNIAVVGNVLPIAVSIQILTAGVIAIGVVPRLRVANQVIAIAVPAIPVVALGSSGNFVLRGIGVATDRGHVAVMNFGAALRRGNLRLTLTDHDDRVAIGTHFDAEDSVMMRRVQ